MIHMVMIGAWGTLEFQLTKVSLKGHTIVVQILDFVK